METSELKKGRYYIYRMVNEETGARRLYKVKYTGEMTKDGKAMCIPKQGKQFKGKLDCVVRMMTPIDPFHDSSESTRKHTPGGLGGVTVTGS